MSEIVCQTMELSNKPWGCTTLIDLKPTVSELPEGMTTLYIKRKTDNQATWKTIYTHEVNSFDDLTVTFEDRNTIAGENYTYTAIPVVSSREKIGPVERITPQFAGWYIADKTAEYEVGLNVVFSKKKNTSLAYIQTLASKYPYAISNGNLNYYTGSFSAIFLPRTADREFTKDGNHKFKDEVMEFLTNGLAKILKSEEGEAMKIRINDPVDLNHSDYPGAAEISFSFTQIGDFPDTGLVVIPK